MSHYRYTSRLLAVVHSWQSDKLIDLSRHVVSCVCRKAIKRVGSAGLVLAPAQNWFNLIFPNDIINIYYDPGDGQTGWTRVFMGYVDRVSRSEAVVDDSGAVSTQFTVSCSDFMKAVDRSEVIFRAELAQRTDWSLDARFFFANLGGLGTMLRGLAMTGSPDSVVDSVLATFLGYGGQFQLPKAYAPVVDAQRKRQRSRRRQQALLRIPTSVQDAIRRAGFGQLFRNDVANTREVVKSIFDLVYSSPSGLTNQQKVDYAAIRSAGLYLTSYANIVEDTQGQPVSMYDIMDPSFMEGLCIDGWTDAAPLHQNVGAVSNICYRYANEAVNELSFDLRPVAATSDGLGDSMSGDEPSVTTTEPREVGYSRSADDLGFNDGTRLPPGVAASSVPGVRYVPAIVMREYPYSTARSVDMRKYGALGLKGAPLGEIAFGPVFATRRKSTDPVARLLYDYSSDGLPDGITNQRSQYPESAQPYKHLDAAIMRLDEMTAMDVSRGDDSAINLFIFSQVLGPNGTKFNVPDILPIFNLASIARDGVRVRDAESVYFGRGKSIGDKQVAEVVAWGVYRWSLLQDHWYQHNPEYLSGTVQSRPRVDIRAGYRLDVPQRMESYYVEEHEHSFSVQANGSVAGHSRFTLSRGQRTDPFPIYIQPSVSKARALPDADDSTEAAGRASILTDGTDDFPDATADEAAQALLAGGGNRGLSGRLAKFFPIYPSDATVKSREAAVGPDATENTTDKKPARGTGYYVPAFPGDGTERA